MYQFLNDFESYLELALQRGKELKMLNVKCFISNLGILLELV